MVKLRCPNDTDGDENCGKPLCPYCGEHRQPRDWRTDIITVLEPEILSDLRLRDIADRLVEALGLEDWPKEWQPHHPAVHQARILQQTVEEQARIIDNLRAALDEQRKQLRELLHPTSGQLGVATQKSVLVTQIAT